MSETTEDIIVRASTEAAKNLRRDCQAVPPEVLIGRVLLAATEAALSIQIERNKGRLNELDRDKNAID